MSKEQWLAAHEELVTEYLDKHPSATWQEAYDRTANGAWSRSRETYAAMVDHLRTISKERNHG